MAKIVFKKLPVDMRDHLHELSGNELKVWLYFHLRTGEDSTAFPSNKSVAAKTGLNLDTVKVAKTKLRKLGWLEAGEHRTREDGSFSTVVEKTHLPWLEKPTAGGGKNPPRTVVENFPLPPVENFHQLEVDTVEVDTGNLEGLKQKEEEEEKLASLAATSSDLKQKEKVKTCPVEPQYAVHIPESDDIESLWMRYGGSCFRQGWNEKTGRVDDEVQLAITQMYIEGGVDSLSDWIRWTFECPKTSGIGFTDFWFWIQQLTLTKSTIMIWQRKLDYGKEDYQKKFSESNIAARNGWMKNVKRL